MGGKNTELVTISSSSGSSPPRDQSPCLLYLLHWQADSLPLSHLGRLFKQIKPHNSQLVPSSSFSFLLHKTFKKDLNFNNIASDFSFYFCFSFFFLLCLITLGILVPTISSLTKDHTMLPAVKCRVLTIGLPGNPQFYMIFPITLIFCVATSRFVSPLCRWQQFFPPGCPKRTFRDWLLPVTSRERLNPQ